MIAVALGFSSLESTMQRRSGLKRSSCRAVVSRVLSLAFRRNSAALQLVTRLLQSFSQPRSQDFDQSRSIVFGRLGSSDMILLGSEGAAMGLWSLLQYCVFLLIVALLVKPVGGYLARVFEGEKTFLDPALRPIERLIYRIARIDPEKEMNWKGYAVCFVLSGLAGTLLLYAIQRLQRYLPWYYPEYITAPMTPDLAMNNAISFSTTTTWQSYAGESTLTYVTQTVGLVAQNFLAGASGLAVGIAFIRGLARDETDRLGNFWVDLVRGSLWVLLPISLVGSVVLVSQGVPMNFSRYTQAATVEGTLQIIAQGPVASLELIKNLGTNGGGFFNVNAA